MLNADPWFHVSNKLAFHPPEYYQLSDGHAIIDHLPVHFLSTTNWSYGIKGFICWCSHQAKFG